MIRRYDKTKTPDVEKRIAVVRDVVAGCDCVLANLESPLTSKTRTLACKGVYLRSDPINVESLKYMGVTHVTLANNHVYDYGKTGAQGTIETLDKAGIRYVGLNNRPEVVKCGESSIMLDGFCCLSTNALNYGKKPGQVKILSQESMEEFLDYAEKEHYLPIVSVHFGLEGLHYPSKEHIQLFRKLAEKYDYVLHGNHPHAMQGYESHNNSLLIYAQGNLCFDETPNTSIGITPEEKPEERKCYISIVEIAENRITSHKAIGLTDLDTGMLHQDNMIEEQLKVYCSAMNQTIADIEAKREEEMNLQKSSAQPRNMRFYLDRMNYKYIGAYLKGRKHAKKYAQIMRDFKA